MGIFNNLKAICWYCLACRQGRTHSERMENVYGKRSGDYDQLHSRHRPGRQELFENLPISEGAVWIDMGAGTGVNLEYLGDRLAKLAKVYLVESAPSMIATARLRIERRGWRNVEIVDANALSFSPSTGPVDIVTFSYSLGVIQPWFAALERTRELLKPGGCVGVVEFHVSPKHAQVGRVQHNWLTRTVSVPLHHLWEVFPDPNHVAYLHTHFSVQHFAESAIRTIVPGLQFPYFVFVGKKAPHCAGQLIDWRSHRVQRI